jgi:hypothetical protein
MSDQNRRDISSKSQSIWTNGSKMETSGSHIMHNCTVTLASSAAVSIACSHVMPVEMSPLVKEVEAAYVHRKSCSTNRHHQMFDFTSNIDVRTFECM